MTTSEPFFSAKLLVTAPNGTYGGIRKRRRVAAFDDRLEIADVPIHYMYVTDLRVYDNILHVGYVAADGKQVEQFFRHDTFLAKRGAKALQAMAANVAEARQSLVKPSIWKPAPKMQTAVKAELLQPTTNGWQRVGVYSALVAFPAICPVCAKPADAIGRMVLARGFGEKGTWYVPVCHEHEHEIASYLAVANWRSEESRLEFHVWNRRYAEEFAIVNQGVDVEHIRRQAEASPLLHEIRNGKRFVFYQYATSIVVMSFLTPSKFEVLEPGDSAVVRGLKYSAISLIAGWWGIPAGPIFTVSSIVDNFRGGIDETQTIAAILHGAALSGGGHT
jgi:hypothetical protein